MASSKDRCPAPPNTRPTKRTKLEEEDDDTTGLSTSMGRATFDDRPEGSHIPTAEPRKSTAASDTNARGARRATARTGRRTAGSNQSFTDSRDLTSGEAFLTRIQTPTIPETATSLPHSVLSAFGKQLQQAVSRLDKLEGRMTTLERQSQIKSSNTPVGSQ